MANIPPFPRRFINGFKLFDQNLSLTAGEPMKQTEMLALNIFNTFYGRVGYQVDKGLLLKGVNQHDKQRGQIEDRHKREENGGENSAKTTIS